MKKLFSLTAFSLFLLAGPVHAQLYISAGSTFFIQPTGVVTVQGDVTGLTDIQGGGKVLLKGSALQNVNMNGFVIPNLEIDNTSNAALTGNTKIGSSLLFTNGKILAGNFNLNLADVATVSGMGTSKFVETSGTGQVIKEMSTNLTNSEIPVGAGTLYRPAFLTSTGTTGGNAGIRVLPVVDPNLPVNTSDHLNVYWPVTKTGAVGTLNVAGKYDISDVSGTQANLFGYYYQPTDWSSAGESHTPASFLVAAPISAASGELTGIDKFNLVSAKAFLQAAYSAGAMNDVLRTAGAGGTNLIPLSEPYRTTNYNANFTHVNNPITETAAASVFTVQAPTSNNIVDWVFLELRNNASPGSVVVQTRSALIRKDGMIVDVDGVSPVTFNNIASGSYTLAVRHRNHLGIATDPVNFTHNFSDVKSGITPVDFTTATDLQLYGNANAFTTNGGNVLLWAGDANSNKTIKYSGSSTDPNAVLSQVLAFPGNGAGAYNYAFAIGYFSGDVNMDGKVKFSGSNTDPNYILTNVLAYPGNTTGAYNYAVFTQQLPLP